MHKQFTRRVGIYAAVFQRSEDGGYVAHVPELAGCATQGETFAETKKNIADAISGYLEALRDSPSGTESILTIPAEAKIIKPELLRKILEAAGISEEEFRNLGPL